MSVLVILAHPRPGSFNHAIARCVVQNLSRSGYEVIFHDLYGEGFDPVLSAAELDKSAVLLPVIEKHCDEVCKAEGIVIVHPNWWSSPPAILRGWVDRVFRAGRAYMFVTDSTGKGHPKGLLSARVAVVFYTSNTPPEVEQTVYGEPIRVHWEKVVFGLCGVPKVIIRNFAPVVTSTVEQREAWLSEVELLLREVFPPR